MNKERIIGILEDYEYFVDDDYGGSYQHIDCSQRACTPMGILQILDYIDKLESNWKSLKQWLEEQLMYFKENNEQSGFSDNVEDLEMVLDKMNWLEGDK